MGTHRVRNELVSSSEPNWAHRLALLSGVVLVTSFVSVLYRLSVVAGGMTWLLFGVGVAFAGGTVAGRVFPLPVGLSVGGLLLGVGVGAYVFALPDPYVGIRSFQFASDLLVLLFGGLSLVQILRVDLWVALIAPAPVFGTWYLLVRRRYDLGAAAGGLTVGFFVLTGDAGETVALVGTVAVFAVLGFGSLSRTNTSWHQLREVGFLLALIVVGTRLVRPLVSRFFAPSGESSFVGSSGSSQLPTVEGSLLSAPSRVGIQGSISLSPEVRFVVTADQPSFWHVAAYDRFTSEGWVRTGESAGSVGALGSPPGDTETVRQTFEARTLIDTMPAAWKAVSVDEPIRSRTRTTALGGLQPMRAFSAGESYTVTSERPDWTTQRLNNANGNAPASVRDRYLQIPSSTPTRVGRFAAELTTDTETQLERVVAIERWLERNKAYSLDVTRPTGDVADAFIFEMDAGYCVYYATAMTIMLRTLDIPARFTVGYSTGQQVGEDEWLVRGFNSHAWVEVYFTDIGWVTFNPTPSSPRQAERQQRLRAARSAGADRVDVTASRPTPTPGPTPTRSTIADQSASQENQSSERPSTPEMSPASSSTENPLDEQVGAVAVDQQTSGGGTGTPQSGLGENGISRRSLFTDLSGSDQLALLAGIAGVTLGASRFGLLRRGIDVLELLWQSPNESPKDGIERSFERLETVLARQYRARRDGETRHEYIRAFQREGHPDERLDRILDIYHRTVYSGERSEELTAEARRLTSEIVWERILFTRQ